jgi:hypothetical protein
MNNTRRVYKLLIGNKLIVLFISILILADFLCSKELSSQQTEAKGVEDNVRNYYEELFLLTDRDVYITGEDVWFKVYKLNGLTHIPANISKVVYVELLDKNYFPLKQVKVNAASNSGASGFVLPDNLSSGNYIIRAYSNWMKNYSAELYFYKEISVINPFGNIENLKLNSEKVVSASGNYEYGSPFQFIASGNKGGQSINRGSENINYTITLQKPEYGTRQKVKIAIKATDKSGNPVETDLSVSVAKSAVVNSTGMYILRDRDISFTSEVVPTYLPELEGLLISGLMKGRSTGEPLGKTDVSLSYVGKSARCQFGKTDENGEFHFIVKESGLNEIVIQPLIPDPAGYYVELNQSFSSTFSPLKPSDLYLDSSKIKGINNAIVSMQINNIYEPFRQIGEVKTKNGVHDFFGTPENSVKMADYIELTSLREVVKEIIPNVYTLKQNGKYDLKLINKLRGLPFENKPLVLVDGVPIYDFEKVLNINSKEIERADIINTRYFYSDIIFDGILSFITKKGNLSALEFDNSVFRQAYEACQVKKDFYSPDYSTDQLKESRIPDYRNTLYWKPDLQTMEDGKAETEFFTSDESAEYTIVVEGIAFDGRRGFASATLSVK